MRLSFDEPEERRTLAGGSVAVDVVRIAGMPVRRISHAAGWRWSRDSAPSDSGADRCPASHVGVMTAGELAVEEADGETYVLRAGDPVAIPPGHDAWTVGLEAAVLIQFDEGDSAQQRFGLS